VKTGIEKAAEKIAEAEILLFASGAGFSADSGLAVYADISNEAYFKEKGLTYADICSQMTLEQNPDLFYDFFFRMSDQYKDTAPHRGYKLLLDLKHQNFNATNEDSFTKEFNKAIRTKMQQVQSKWKNEILEHLPGPFFCYTSNVDGHFRSTGFAEQEIEEMHGSIDFWQCANPHQCKEPFESGLWWWLPQKHRFREPKEQIEKDSVLPDIPSISGFKRNEEEQKTCMSFHSRIPRCIACGGKARPNIVMFNDCNFVDGIETSHYLEWEQVADEFAAKGAKIAILEVGCGLNVPSIRVHTEELLHKWPTSTLIRVNPTESSYTFIEKNEEHDSRFIGLQLPALQAMELLCDQPCLNTND